MRLNEFWSNARKGSRSFLRVRPTRPAPLLIISLIDQQHRTVGNRKEKTNVQMADPA
ncbi:hypothetical protein HKBW3S43_00913 [Candidatus Hakubella thermalkaliphila]|uniref:Uncharacterized protein n=1 Tax=Candidatus Hakubella thermalkaliphila TaxID=2754717 RepID=A0A6V8PWL3_9ACTN|nr:hypothetical protein HKBW3S06_01093 [Candidatus Hakubella thermalkaliphila]GFP25415.1 hypothetical protein HKBW3S25_00887 [Candidatus Hakubella thermalkaliphila]GFP35121.1 hypothetical protein HKBW3S43_00913 [Candidatus Hakubella thermalkaliphila]